MLALIIILVLLTRLEIIKARRCFPENEVENDEFCFACGASYFFIGNNSSLGKEPFSRNLCIEKEKKPINLSLVIPTLNSNYSGCTECTANGFMIKKSLSDALVYSSKICSLYISCELLIYLESTSYSYHFIDESIEGIDLFRRSNATIIIDSLPCENFFIGLGFACGDFPAKLILKSSAFTIYVSGSIYLRNIELDGIDMNVKDRTLPCFKNSICCSFPLNDICDAPKIVLTRKQKPLGIFTMELIADHKYFIKPTILIENSSFKNVYAINKDLNFNSLISSIGYHSYEVSLKNSHFQNIYFDSGILCFVEPEDLIMTGDLYLGTTTNELRSLVQSLIKKDNETTSFIIYFSNVVITSYTIKDISMLQYSLETIQGIIVFIESSQELKVIIKSLSLVNITFSANLQACYGFYYKTRGMLKNSFFLISDAEFDTVKYVGLLSASSISIFESFNTSVTKATLNTTFPFIHLKNINHLLIKNFFAETVSSAKKTSSIFLENCENFTALNFSVIKMINMSIDFFGCTRLIISSINLHYIGTGGILFLTESCVTFILDNLNLINLYQTESASETIFFLASEIFNLTDSIFSGVLFQSFFALKNVQYLGLKNITIQNIVEMLSFFTEESTFTNCFISELFIKNSSISRFTKFFKFQTTNRTFYLTNSKFQDLILPAIMSQIFISFIQTFVTITNTIFYHIRRVNHTIIPTAIIHVTLFNLFYLENCSFVSVGYTYNPTEIIVVYNFALLLLTLHNNSIIKNSYFELDENVSVNGGIIFSGYNYNLLDISNCYFIARTKRRDLIYNGLKLFHSPNLNLSRNIFYNLGCSPFNIFDDKHRKGAIALIAEDSFLFNSNSKKAYLGFNSFEKCNRVQGGALFFSNYHYIILSNNIFTENNAQKGGSIFIMSSTYTHLNSTIVIASTAFQGASLCFIDITGVLISNYKDIFSKGIELGAWDIFNSDLKCFELYVCGSTTSASGGFASLSRSNATIDRAILINLTSAVSGGGFNLVDSSSIQLINIEAQNTSAFNGGFINCQDSKYLDIQNSVFLKSLAKFNGAAFYIDLVFQTSFLNLTIADCFAYSKGVIYIKTVDQNSFHKLSHIFFKGSETLSGSCVFFISPSDIEIKEIKVFRCFGTAFVLSSNIRNSVSLTNITAASIDSVSFIDLLGLDAIIMLLQIQSSVFEKSIVNAKSSELNVFNVNFKDISPKNDQKLQCIDIERANATISALIYEGNSNFSSVLRLRNGILFIVNSLIFSTKSVDGVVKLEKSNFSADGLVFQNNGFSCIFLIESNLELNNSRFLENVPDGFEQASDIQNINKILFNGFIKLKNVSSELSNQGIAYILKNYKQVNITNCSFGSHKKTEISIEAMQIINVRSLFLSNVSFKGFSSKINRGSALKFGSDTDFHSTLHVIATGFHDCISSAGGGAFYLVNTNYVSFDSCIFSGNIALKLENPQIIFSGIGGVGIVTCVNGKNENKCEIYVRDSIFSNNFAFYFGPLIVSNISLLYSNLLMSNNSDALNFTSSFSFFPLKFNMYLFNNLSSEIWQNSGKFELGKFNKSLKVTSGQYINITFEVVDSLEQTLIFDNKSSCAIENVAFGAKKSTIINGNSLAKKGIFMLSSLNLKNFPDTLSKLLFTFKISKNMLLNPEPITIDFEISIYFKPCVVGEIILPDLSCFKCPKNYFSKIDPMKEFTETIIASDMQKCEACSPSAECPGGSLDFPKPSYWRFSPSSKYFQECFIQEACEGPGDYTQIDVLGRCKAGHFGNMCHECSRGFGKMSSISICESCGSNSVGVLVKLVCLILFLMGYTIGTSYLYSINSFGEKNETHIAVFLKIALNFSQTIMLISFIKFKWVLPNLKQQITNFTSSINLTAESILLNDCLFQNLVSDMCKLYSVKVIIVMFLPLMCSGCASCFWILLYFIRKKMIKASSAITLRKKLLIRLSASLIISVFLFHPLIVKSSFNILNCFELDKENSNPESFLLVSPCFKCWTDYHYNILLIYAVPGVVIWGLLFPAMLIILLLKQRDLQDRNRHTEAFSSKQEFALKKQKIITNPFRIKFEENINKRESISITILKSKIFDFLFDGLHPQFSYWECINFFKNLLVSFLINANQFLGYEIMVLFTLLILFSALLMHLKCQPYKLKELNFLELLNNISVILIFQSLIMLSTDLPSLLEYALGIFIFVVYLIFFITTIFLIAKIVKEKRLLSILWNKLCIASSLGKKTGQLRDN